MREQAARFYLIDAIRGCTVVSMVAYHFLYDVCIVYGADPAWAQRPAVHLWQQSICWTFILISGFAWSWGRKTALRRGILLNLCGLAITLVTCLALPSEAIWFGVLNFIGCAVLLLLPLEGALRRVPPALGLALSFALFLLCRDVPEGFFGLSGLLRVQLPASLYSARLLTPLGFPFPGFRSSDYFPLLPWMFLYLCGYFLRPVILSCETERRLARQRVPVLSALGTKTLWIYLAHQPVCMLVCMILFS